MATSRSGSLIVYYRNPKTIEEQTSTKRECIRLHMLQTLNNLLRAGMETSSKEGKPSARVSEEGPPQAQVFLADPEVLIGREKDYLGD